MSHELASLQIIPSAVIVVLSLALLAALYRMVKGPSAADRLVAFDITTLLVMGIAVTGAIMTDERVLLDVAVVLALTTFVGTVALAGMLARSGRPEGP